MTDHPDLERLAELAEGLLPDDEAARLRAHVAGCAACADRQGLLDRTRRVLAAAPPAPMPDEVAARLDAALAAAATELPDSPSATDELGTRRVRRVRRRPGGRTAALAAAATVVLLAVAVVLGTVRHGGNGSSSNGSSAATGALATALQPAPTATFLQTSTGRDYTKATLAQALSLLPPSAASLKAGPAAPQRNAATQEFSRDQTTTGSAGGLASAGQAPAAAVDPQLARLHDDPRALFACIAGLQPDARTPAVPLAVDFARWDGKPALVVLLPAPDDPAKVETWVVGPTCSRADPALRYFASFPR